MDEKIYGGKSDLVKEKSEKIIDEVSKIIVGQYQFIEHLVVALLSEGHVLIEGVPGLGKTLTARALASSIQSDFKRIQFTPDLMPADVMGTKVFNTTNGSFYFKKGPLFSNIILADEINRTPPKTQSALLEAMQEKSITIDGETHILEEPFMVLATQNPVEYEGTYPLPEAQLDRFMMKLLVNYIPQKFENELLSNFNSGYMKDSGNEKKINSVITHDDIKACREIIQGVRCDESIINYISSISRATRNSPAIILGASPRASIAVLKTSKTLAAMQGRDFVTPEDVVDMVYPVMRHRIILKPEAGIEGIGNDEVLKSIVEKVEVPR